MARPDEQDTTRRDFFRTFGRETVRQAGAVAGAAAELRRSSLEAARELFDPQAATDLPAVRPTDPAVEVDAARPDATFRSAYLYTGTQITALDARQLPGRVETIALVQPSEVTSAIRAGAINGGPVLAEVGAYAMALAARAVIERPATGRVQQMRAAADTLRTAKPGIHALTWAADRLEALYLELEGQGADPTEVAESVVSEADAIALANTGAQAQIGRFGAEAVSSATSDPINLLMHADMGPLSCGMVGMGTALIQELRDAGRAVHVWLTDAAPGGEGGRVAAFAMRQLDVPFTVIPDAAVGWLLDRYSVAALVLRGDKVAANGDCGVIVGGLSAAIVAASADVPVIVLAPRTSFDPGAADGAALRADETFAPGSARLNPSSDVVPHDLVRRLISEAQ